jgi:ABC-2 type transport system permease protein
MRKVLHVAVRDFLATVSTRGFIIAIVLPPAVYALLIFVFPRFNTSRAPGISGEITVIDRTGSVFDGVQAKLSPEAIARRRDANLNRTLSETGMRHAPAATQAVETAVGEVPNLHVVRGDVDSLARQKDALREGSDRRRLAVVVIHADAVSSGAGQDRFGSYDLFIGPKLDDRIQNEIRRAVDEAIVDERIRREGLNRQHIDALTSIPRVRPVTVTEQGDAATFNEFNQILPFAFAALMMISVMTSGQYLLTTTIEEKSSRTMEVLLSAVSPLQLMAGKILGQLGVGLVILVLYASMGIAALVSMAMIGLLDFSLLIYLLIFFLIMYTVMGSTMAAIGSAVNDLREAQALMMPVTLVVMLPWFFLHPITRDPNALFSVVLSLVPPMSAFAMLFRMTSTVPPPLWQVWLSIVAGVAAAGAAFWFASRVFKIGLLMHGRPPNFATLVRWARQG